MLREKTTLRQEMKERLALLPAKQFREAGLKAVSVICSSPIWDQYKTILLFMSMKNEIDTLPLLEAALKDKKKVFLPRVEEGGQRKIRFYRVQDSWNSDSWNRDSLNQNSYGILEPFPKDPLEAADFPALIFTPGLAFDRQGNRLGRGKGYYDRFFAEIEGKEFEAVGLCMGIQIIPSAPVEKWDHKVTYLCADRFYRTEFEPRNSTFAHS